MKNKSNIEVTGRDFLILLVRYLLCLVFPPLAVFDKGCGTILLVFFFHAHRLAARHDSCISDLP